ncbi:MAG: Cof-type HAD-IIB family hydrolase [Rikenellaceae bacterium]
MVKALFLDIDGTLVSFKTHSIPESTIEALVAAKAKGVKIFIATGRAKSMINNLEALDERNLIDGYITMNGSYCVIDETVVFQNTIPNKEAEIIVNYCKNENKSCVVIKEDQPFIFQPTELFEDIFYNGLHVDKMEEVNLEDATKGKIYQLTPFVTEEEETNFNTYVQNCELNRWFPAFTDIGAKGNTKSRGIDAIIEHFGISLDETMAIGDGGNDIPMLKHAAVSVAMGNASDTVKSTAKYVTDSVDDNGIYNAVERFITKISKN